MNKDILMKTALRLTSAPKGILAADESSGTCNGRFEKLGVPITEEKRRQYRELLITAPGVEKYLSGYILYDETIKQSAKDGTTFPALMQAKGVDVGIKVDTGTKDFPLHVGEKITEGLDGLSARLKDYKALGATFAKWRAVITIGENIPTDACLKANANSLARYALACQAEDIVPIVEPEVLLDGAHSIERCAEVTAHNLDIMFAEFKALDVFIPGVILKTSMVISGKEAPDRANAQKVAEMTLDCLKKHVPTDIGGVVFLSGGQSEEESTVHLNLMHQMGALPWNLSFSYSRAIQARVLEYWAKNPDDVAGAQKLLLEIAEKNSLASMGQYK